MFEPTDDHWQMVKRILRYIKGTLSLLASLFNLVHILPYMHILMPTGLVARMTEDPPQVLLSI
jgi:hypothetical protein